MKPARFSYVRPETVEEALGALEEHGDEARILAGGQSLVPMMHVRLAEPSVVVDINPLRELAGVSSPADGVVRVGALTRHIDLEHLVEPRDLAPLFAEVASHIGHVPIRVRGTFGGSLAHADPSAEWPVVAVALGATLVLRSASAERTIEAEAFFEGPYTTVLAENELLSCALVTSLEDRSAFGFAEVSRRPGDFATALCAVRLDACDGWISSASLALGGLAGGVGRCAAAESLLVGAALDSVDPAAVGDAVREASFAHDDLHATAEYRLAMAGVAACDATREALARARRQPAGGSRAAGA